MSEKKDEALKLALEALERHAELGLLAGSTITAIREALAHAPEVREQPRGEATLAQQQEPVATVTSESGNPNVAMSWWHEPALPVGTKLYTSPPASKPLTDEQIGMAFRKAFPVGGVVFTNGAIDFARNIEAAHGIKGDE